MPFGLPAGKPPRFDQRFDRHVIAAAAQGADAVGQMQIEGDMAVYAVRLVAVEPVSSEPGSKIDIDALASRSSSIAAA